MPAAASVAFPSVLRIRYLVRRPVGVVVARWSPVPCPRSRAVVGSRPWPGADWPGRLPCKPRTAWRAGLADAGVILMAGSGPLQLVRELYLTSNDITDDGLVALAEAFRPGNALELLDISRNKVGDRGMSSTN